MKVSVDFDGINSATTIKQCIRQRTLPRTDLYDIVVFKRSDGSRYGSNDTLVGQKVLTEAFPGGVRGRSGAAVSFLFITQTFAPRLSQEY